MSAALAMTRMLDGYEAVHDGNGPVLGTELTTQLRKIGYAN